MIVLLHSLERFTVRDVLDQAPSTMYSVNGSEPIILAGVHLSSLEVEAVASLTRTNGVNGIILGYCVLRLINAKNLWTVFYRTKVADVRIPVLKTTPDENLLKTVRRIKRKGWGYAVVIDSGGKPSNILGLLDLASFYAKSGVATELSNQLVGKRASTPLYSIREEVTVQGAIRTMLAKHARRLFVKESSSVLSDRGIIKWLLSPPTLAGLRDSPESVLKTQIGSIGEVLHRPSFVEPGTNGETALKLALENDAHCVITQDKRQILTPWDLTVRLQAL